MPRPPAAARIGRESMTRSRSSAFHDRNRHASGLVVHHRADPDASARQEDAAGTGAERDAVDGDTGQRSEKGRSTEEPVTGLSTGKMVREGTFAHFPVARLSLSEMNYR